MLKPYAAMVIYLIQILLKRKFSVNTVLHILKQSINFTQRHCHYLLRDKHRRFCPHQLLVFNQIYANPNDVHTFLLLPQH